MIFHCAVFVGQPEASTKGSCSWIIWCVILEKKLKLREFIFPLIYEMYDLLSYIPS